MVSILRQMEPASKRMVDYSEKIMAQQDQKIALYEYLAGLLKERIAHMRWFFRPSSVTISGG